MENHDTSNLITRKEAAAHLRVSERTIYRLERRGLLQPVKLSYRCIRYRWSALQVLIKSSQNWAAQSKGGKE
jgi:predicted DNA-binding transcriptional regulator AlpA